MIFATEEVYEQCTIVLLLVDVGPARRISSHEISIPLYVLCISFDRETFRPEAITCTHYGTAADYRYKSRKQKNNT